VNAVLIDFWLTICRGKKTICGSETH